MIKRYEIKEISDIWSEESKFNNWKLIELLNCEALNKLKLISNKELELITLSDPTASKRYRFGLFNRGWHVEPAVRLPAAHRRAVGPGQ